MSREEMTLNVRNVGMMGYGQPHNTVLEQATPIYSRALYIENDNAESWVWVTVEICFITIAIRNEVVKRVKDNYPQLKLNEKNIILTAQHTHSAPGGYSHFPLYNFSIPGFVPEVFEEYVRVIVKSILRAHQNKKNAKISLGSVDIPENVEIAFNRSLRAYNQNPEVKELTQEEAALGVDRTVTGLKVEGENDQLIGMISFFGVHATSISSFNHKIHHDNKGIASALLEQRYPNSVMIMAQKAAGDISPNFIFDHKIKRTRGKFKDQFESCLFNGELQANWSEVSLNNAKSELSSEINSNLALVDMPSIKTKEGLRGATPSLGLAFFEGAPEGPGVPKELGKILGVLSDMSKLKKINVAKEYYEIQGNKKILFDAWSGEFLGMKNLWKYLPVIGDLTVKTFIRHSKNNSLVTKPWIPSILPIQWASIGSFVILIVPGEITHIAAQRLIKTCEKILGPNKKIIVGSYANAYMGYITTPEEYQAQCYEGGHTVYGQWTLPILEEAFVGLLKNEKASWTRDQFETFPQTEIDLRSWSKHGI